MSASAKPGSVAQVDNLVDERGYKIPVGDDVSLKIATDVEQAVGATGPASWWRLGLLALFVIAAVLLAMQLLGGGASTAVIPGTPVTAPQPGTPVTTPAP